MSISTFRSIVFSAATLSTVLTSAAAQTPAAPQRFPLTDTKGLVAPGLTMDTTDFLGRKDVRLVKTREGSVDGFVPRLHRHRLPRPPGRLQLRHVLRSSGRCESRPAARLYLNDNPEPTPVVDGLKGLDLHHQAAAADQKRIEAADHLGRDHLDRRGHVCSQSGGAGAIAALSARHARGRQLPCT